MKGVVVVGTRPNFIKASVLYKPLSRFFEIEFIHTGQHYDKNMITDLDVSHVFNLKTTGHANQTAEIMVKFGSFCDNCKPGFVVVIGDVNSTLACALTATKKHIPVVHIEAGLRSFDKSMPEEINRVLVDHISNILFTTEPQANSNLKKENISGKYFLTGDIVLDVLINSSSQLTRPTKSSYSICTIHRESNIQNKTTLKLILENLPKNIIFPVHPHTARKILDHKLSHLVEKIHARPPMSYIKFMSYIKYADFVVTDSGGIQAECNYLNVPCLVLRENTERIHATKNGCCELIGFNWQKLSDCIETINSGDWKKGSKLKIDDGKSAERIANILNEKLN